MNGKDECNGGEFYECKDKANEPDNQICCEFEVEKNVRKRSGHNGVRNIGWGFGCDCNFGNHCISSKITGVVGRHFVRHKQLIGQSGQGTVEYAIVFCAVICVIAAVGTLSSSLQDGLFVEHAISAASHNVQSGVGGVSDVFSY
jgi:hypothetical protein